MEPGDRTSHRRMGAARHIDVQRLRRSGRAVVFGDGFEGEFSSMPDIKFSKFLVFVNSAVPCALLGWDAYHHRLGANPQEFALHTTGTLTLVFLCLSLAVTPLRKALGLPWLIQVRRTLGLFTFFYGCLHLFAYTWFDKAFNFSSIVEDTLKRPYIFLGMFAFIDFDSIGCHFNEQDGQTFGRPQMESTAQTRLCRCDLGCFSLLPAGQG